VTLASRFEVPETLKLIIPVIAPPILAFPVIVKLLFPLAADVV